MGFCGFTENLRARLGLVDIFLLEVCLVVTSVTVSHDSYQSAVPRWKVTFESVTCCHYDGWHSRVRLTYLVWLCLGSVWCVVVWWCLSPLALVTVHQASASLCCQHWSQPLRRPAGEAELFLPGGEHLDLTHNTRFSCSEEGETMLRGHGTGCRSVYAHALESRRRGWRLLIGAGVDCGWRLAVSLSLHTFPHSQCIHSSHKTLIWQAIGKQFNILVYHCICNNT